MQLNLKLNKKFYNTGLLLTVLFVVILLAEAYVVYYKIYSNLTVQDGDVATSNVVRVNISQYGDAVKLLNDYESYNSQTFVEGNPFK